MIISRHILCVLALMMTLLAAPVLADEPGEYTQRMDKLMAAQAAASQKVDFFKSFTYWDATMNDSGCGPVSISNMLAAAFRIENLSTVEHMAAELPDALLPRHKRKYSTIVPDSLPPLLSALKAAPDGEDYPTLQSIVNGYQGDMHICANRLSPEDFAAICAEPGEALYVRTIHGRTMWPLLYDLSLALCDAGREDALICLGFLGVGKKNSGSPLYSTGSGHYVAAVLHAGAFAQDGSIYLLDSLPRALGDEPFGDGLFYRKQYPYFADRRFADFSNIYDAVRIQPTIVRFTPTAAIREQFAALSEHPGDADALRQAHMATLEHFVLFGAGLAVVSLPPAA